MDPIQLGLPVYLLQGSGYIQATITCTLDVETFSSRYDPLCAPLARVQIHPGHTLTVAGVQMDEPTWVVSKRKGSPLNGMVIVTRWRPGNRLAIDGRVSSGLAKLLRREAGDLAAQAVRDAVQAKGIPPAFMMFKAPEPQRPPEAMMNA